MGAPTQPKTHAHPGTVLRCAARRLASHQARVAVGDAEQGAGNSEKAHNFLSHPENVNKIWRAVALVINHSLLSTGRGIRIETLGTFALDGKGSAKFFLSSDFAARHRLLKYSTGGYVAGGSVNTRLNIAKVAATAGRPRPDAERVLDAVLRSLHQRLAAGKSATLSFQPVAEFTCVPGGQARMRYLPAFRTRQKAARTADVRALGGVARTNSKATPWAAACLRKTGGSGYDHDAVGDGATGNVGRGETHTPSAGSPAARNAGTFIVKRSDANPAHRPCSSSTSVSQPRRFTSDRPNTVHGGSRGEHGGNWTKMPGEPSTSSDDRSRGAACASDLSTRRRQAWDVAYLNSGTCAAVDVRRPKVSNSSSPSGAFHCASTLSSPRKSIDGRAESRHDYTIHVKNGVHEKNTGQKRHKAAHQHVRRLAHILRRQTLEQAGEEGLLRLQGTLNLMHTGAHRGDNGDGGDTGSDRRLSGRDLLQALRDVGTFLTSYELTEIENVLRRQADRCMSLDVLLATISDGVGHPTQFIKTSHAMRSSLGRVGPPIMPCETELRGTTGSTSELPPPPSQLKNSASAAITQETHPTHSERGTFPKAREGRIPERQGVTHSIGNEPAANAAASRTVDDQVRGNTPRHDVDVGSRGCHGSEYTSRSRQAVEGGGNNWNGIPIGNHGREMKAKAIAPGARWLEHQECWNEVSGTDEVDASLPQATVSANEVDPIVQLADIVYTPPRSLEGLIHVLQASKVTEKPSIALATLSARLLRLRPHLGKARAKEMATAACRYPETQVDLGYLHSLLERRFGRCGSSSSAAIAPPVGGPSSTVVPCAAVDRVRRNLMASRWGLGGLKTALSSASAFGGGSLTKDELRRALSKASGPASTPPTAKDVDDLFVLFSSQTAMGIGGGRVDAATVLRGVRGELNRCRETAVREVFRGLLDLSYVGAEAQRKRAIGGSGTSSGDWGDMDVSGFRSRSLPRESRGGERGDLNFAVPIEQLQKAWCIGSAVDKALLLGGNPNGRGFGTEDASGGVISHESRAKYIDDTQGHLTDQRARKRQGRGSLNGVTLEQFLEYYRDVSAGIDGDDAFKALVLGTWSLDAARASVARSTHRDDDNNDSNHDSLARTGNRNTYRNGSSSSSSSQHDTPKRDGRVRGSGGSEAHVSAGRDGDRRELDRTKEASGGGRRKGRITHMGEGQPNPSSQACYSRLGGVVGGEAEERCRAGEVQTGGTRPQASSGKISLGSVKLSLEGDNGNGVEGGNTHAIHPRSAATAGATEHYSQGETFNRVVASSARDRHTAAPERWKRPERVFSTIEMEGDAQLGKPPSPPTKSTAQKMALTTSTTREASTGNAAQAARANAERSPFHGAFCDELAAPPVASSPRREIRFGATPGTERSTAAVYVQSLFRGHKGRKRVEAETRKRLRLLAEAKEGQKSLERPHALSRRLAGRLPRPKVPGTYGF